MAKKNTPGQGPSNEQKCPTEGLQLFLPSGEKRCVLNNGQRAFPWQCGEPAEKGGTRCSKHTRSYAGQKGTPAGSHMRVVPKSLTLTDDWLRRRGTVNSLPLPPALLSCL